MNKSPVNPDPASLDRLHDIVTPPPAPLWPPAPGWYFVLGLLCAVALVVAVRAFLRWQRNRYRREALVEFARWEKQLHLPAERGAALAAMSELLKRAAITAFGRARVASLTGPAWFAFLDRTGRTGAFSEGAGATLEAAAYYPRGCGDLDEAGARVIAQRVRQWLKDHETGFEPKETEAGREGPLDRTALRSRPSVQTP